MAKTVCRYCEGDIDPDANIVAYTDVRNEDGIDGNDGCTECSSNCDECEYMFHIDALKWHESGVMYCRECWNDKFAW